MYRIRASAKAAKSSKPHKHPCRSSGDDLAVELLHAGNPHGVVLSEEKRNVAAALAGFEPDITAGLDR